MAQRTAQNVCWDASTVDNASPLSAQIWLYQTQKVRVGELSLPSKERPAIY